MLEEFTAWAWLAHWLSHSLIPIVNLTLILLLFREAKRLRCISDSHHNGIAHSRQDSNDG